MSIENTPTNPWGVGWLTRKNGMDRYWKVVRRVGNRMVLEYGQERKVIRCPTKPFAKQLFMLVRPGQVIDETTVALFEKAQLSIQH
jgi:hypothetical protein